MARTPITPDQVRETHKRHRLPLTWAARLDDCKRLVAGWHNRFGACRVLDAERLRALCRRLVEDRYAADECVWAIEAYHDYCQSDPWHVQHPDARKTLAAFFRDERFEAWVDKGAELKLRRRGRRRAASERREGNVLQRAWEALDADARRRLIEQAAAQLEVEGLRVPATIDHPLTRAKAFQLLQRAMEEQRHDTARPLSEAV